METNKLIAEFMGYDTLYSQVDYCTDMAFSFDDLHFHESWDWLMPVAKDIDALFGKNDEVDDMINRVHNAVLQFDKAILHKAVVEFIKFYNQNK